MRVLIVDHFDSFTHNLAQGLSAWGAEVVVRRHDTDVAALLAVRADRVVLSPGPGDPSRTGSSAALLAQLPRQVPVLGVCLGMQLMATVSGAAVRRTEPVHGWATPMTHDGLGAFAGLPQGAAVGRYHSLCVDPETLPPELRPTAWSDGVLMGLRHVARPWEAVQFHPESVLTPDGPRLLANFLRGQGLGAAAR